MVSLLQSVRKRWKEKEESKKKNFEESLVLYEDVAVSWMLTLIKKPLFSLIKDESISLDFISVFGDHKNAFMKMKVRIEAIIKLINHNIKSMPKPLAMFLNSLLSAEKYVF